LRSRLTRGATWSTAGSIAAQGSSLVMAIVVARLLGLQAFGQFVLVQSTSLMLQGVGGLGLGLATTRRVAGLRSRDLERTGRVMGFSLLFTLGVGSLLACLALAAPGALYRSVLGTAGPAGSVRLVGLIAFAEMLTRIQTDILIGLEAFAGMARVCVVRGGLTLSMVALGAYAFGLAGALGALAAAALVTSGVAYIVLRRTCKGNGIPMAFRGVRSETGVLWTSLFVTGSSLSLAVVTWVLNVSLARQTNGLEELALFNAADRWRAAILFLPGLLAQVSLPLLAHTHAQGRAGDCRRLLLGTSSVGLAVTVLPVLVVTWLASALMGGYGQTFVQGRPVLVLLSLACLPTALCTLGAYGLWAAGKIGTMLAIDVLRAVVTLSWCLVRSPFGAVDVAVATLVGYGVAAPLIGLAIWRTTESGQPEAQGAGTVAGAGVA